MAIKFSNPYKSRNRLAADSESILDCPLFPFDSVTRRALEEPPEVSGKTSRSSESKFRHFPPDHIGNRDVSP